MQVEIMVKSVNNSKRKYFLDSSPDFVVQLALSVTTLVGANLVTFLFQNYLGRTVLYFFLVSIIISALLCGLVIAVTTVVLAGFSLAFFYLSPIYSFELVNREDKLQLFFFVLLGLFLAWIGSSLRKANRLAVEAVRARDDLLAIVSHDLKNPLSVVIMNIILLERNIGSQLIEHRQGQGDVKKNLRLIKNSVTRMSRLIEDIQEIGKAEDGILTVNLDSCWVEELVKDANEEMRVLASEKSIQLEICLESSVAKQMVLCDRQRILQVFSNLIGNAIKFSPLNSKIEIGAYAYSSVMIKFFVSDQGTGIAPADISCLFQRRWQASKLSRDGSGLGLWITKGIIEAHHGIVDVKSEVGAGASFYFTLPLSVDQKAEAS